MAKTILGIDIGCGSVKMALCRGGKVRKVTSAPMPENLYKSGRITSPEAMGELIRNTMKKNRIHASAAAFVLPAETAFIRMITSPVISAEQIAYNLPYEFNDYITDELKNYLFDYAVVGLSEEDQDSLELMGVAAPVAVVEEARETLRKAGLKLVMAAPAECAYIALIRRMEAGKSGGDAREYCIIDLGYTSIRMYMFKGDRFEVTRILEVGLSSLDSVIAEALSVDIHLANTYLVSNFQDVQNKDFCISAYGNIAVELMRSLNFYRFSNPDSSLNAVWLCGGGAVIDPLRDAIAATLDLEVHPAGDLLRGALPEEPHAFVRAVGITMG